MDHCCSPVFIGVPVAQSVDLCVVFCGPLLFTRVYWGSCWSMCRFVWCFVDHCCSPRVYWDSCCSICRFVCSALWTIVVHPVFIGVPVAQSVDLCVVFCGPLLFTRVYWGSCCSICRFVWCFVDHCCSPRVYWGSCCSICRFVCSVLWTIVVHPVFIGVPVAQSVDLCVVFCGPFLFTPCLLGFLLLNL